MARSAEGAALTQQHRLRQLQVRAGVLRDLLPLWSMWTAADPDSYRTFVAVAASLVVGGHDQSTVAAAAYWERFRVAENASGTVGAMRVDPPERARIAAALRATGLDATLRGIKAGFSPQAAQQNALVDVSGSVGRMVLRGGNDTLVASVDLDGTAVGWARVTSGSPCAFCAMLASRGPVFKTDRGARFVAHDHDSCTVEPHYDGAEWPGRAREFRAQWRQAQRQAREAGELDRGTANDALNAFRRFRGDT